MAAVVTDWLRHFRFLFKNGQAEFIETLCKWSSHGPYQVLLFVSRKSRCAIQDGCHCLWLAKLFDFFLRTTKPILTKFGTIESDPLLTLPKYCIFVGWFEIQDGRHCHWLTNTFRLFKNGPANFHQSVCKWSSDVLDQGLLFLGWFDIQNGRHDLWLTEIFSTSQERQRRFWPNFVKMVDQCC